MGRGWRPSARLRILGVTVVVVAAALAGSVVLLRQLLVADLAEQLDRRLVQEAEELQEFVGAAPPQGAEEPDAAARRVFDAYLRTNVPDGDEAFLAVVAAEPYLSSAEPPGDLTVDAAWLARTVAFAESGFDVATTTTGDATTLTVPLVVQGSRAGSFTIAVWTAPGRERVDEVVRRAAGVAFVSLLAAATLSWGTAGRVLRPLRDLHRATTRITETDLSQRIAPGGPDEIGALVTTFNGMLDRLQRSFATQRAFLDDAGHELRTPLTIVRGHVELATGQDAWDKARPLVLSELDRMNRIVEDLLLLARAEQQDFVRLRPVDLADVVTVAIDRARALDPDRRYVVDLAPPAVAMLDPHRVEQALVNLVANAVRHTAPGGLVAVGAAVEGRDVRVWVRDDGEGIDPADHARVFQRFTSAAVRSGPGGSAGLGLAIVAAVAAGHHGTVRLDSARGEGAMFTLLFPGSLASADDDEEEDEPGRP
jgi:two-component system, OmpR family, sensor kinase